MNAAMNATTNALLAAGLILACGLARADVRGSADHPLVPRFAGSEIVEYEASPSASYTLPVRAIGGERKDATITVAGKLTRIAYATARGEKLSAVYHHYEMALQDAGFQILYNCGGQSCAPGSAGREFNLAMAPDDLADEMRGREKGQRYLAADLRRTDGTVYVSLYAVRDEPLSSGDERRVLCNLVVVESPPRKP